MGSTTELTGELIFPGQDKHCHGSSLVELPGGDLLACWFYGSGERKADDVVIMGSYKKAGQSEWVEPYVLADTPGFPDCNPVLWLDGKNRLHLTWIAVLGHAWQRSLLKHRICTNPENVENLQWEWRDVIHFNLPPEFVDEYEKGIQSLQINPILWLAYAKEYQDLIKLSRKDESLKQMGWMTRIHPFQYPDGRVLLPLYSDGYNVGLLAISEDYGDTWRPSKPIFGLAGVQPSLVAKKDGTLVAYMRDNGPPPQRALRAESTDRGETWSLATDTDLLNPGSSLEVIALRDGRWVIVYNDTEEGRHLFALALSDDEGQTWKSKRYLEKAEPGKGSFSYPSMIQARDGSLHLTYTHNLNESKSIKHVSLDPEWINEKK